MKHALEASYAEFSRTIPARTGVVVAAGARTCLASSCAWSSGVAWSTSKVPLAIAALHAGADSTELIFKAITQSDNAAAEELWSRLGDPAEAAQRVQAVICEAGDTATVVESRRLRAGYTPFGQTRWSLANQARFAAGLSGVPGASEVIDLMRSLSSEHRWGLAAKGFAAKGGWGPGLADDYLVRQFAIVSPGVGVALAAEVDDGGYEAGVEVINAMSDWVVERLELTDD